MMPLRSIAQILRFLILPIFATSALAAEPEKAPEAASSETYVTGAWLLCIGPSPDHKATVANCTEALQDEKIIGVERAFALYSRGIGFYGLENYEGAIADYTESLKLNPIAVPAYNNRGVAFRRLGKFEAAIADFDAALAREPDDAAAFANRAISKDELGRTQEAIDDVSKAIEVAPGDGAYWQERGSYRTRLELWDDAIGDFDEAVALDPNRTPGPSTIADIVT